MIGGLWLFFTIVLLIISVITKQVSLFLVFILFFMAGGIARLWDHYSLHRVEYRRRLSSNRVFFGEEVKMEVEVSNRKPLPLPWLQVDDTIPNEVTVLKVATIPDSSMTHQLLRNLFSISWYQKVKKHYSITMSSSRLFYLRTDKNQLRRYVRLFYPLQGNRFQRPSPGLSENFTAGKTRHSLKTTSG